VAGDTLSLVYAEAVGEDILVTTPNGVSLRLTGLRWLAGQLQAGDTLAVRVVTTQPVMELELTGPPTQSRTGHTGGGAASGPLEMQLQAAMRLDQAELRTISWRAPSPAVLAATWRTLAEERWLQANVVADPWLAPVYAWGGVSISLRLLEADEERPRRGAPRRRGALALRLDFSHPTLGLIQILVQWSVRGIRLELTIEEESSVAPIRECLPAVITALARVDLRVAHLHVAHGKIARTAATPAPARRAGRSLNAEALSPGLFRSAAELVAAVLLGRHEPGRFSRVTR
jgi:hypothetical protein